eukprot:6433187-Amphidinium_carterae.1
MLTAANKLLAIIAFPGGFLRVWGEGQNHWLAVRPQRTFRSAHDKASCAFNLISSDTFAGSAGT